MSYQSDQEGNIMKNYYYRNSTERKIVDYTLQQQEKLSKFCYQNPVLPIKKIREIQTANPSFYNVHFDCLEINSKSFLSIISSCEYNCEKKMEIYQQLKIIQEFLTKQLHYNLKPSNIIYDQAIRRLYLVDFGFGRETIKKNFFNQNKVYQESNWIPYLNDQFIGIQFQKDLSQQQNLLKQLTLYDFYDQEQYAITMMMLQLFTKFKFEFVQDESLKLQFKKRQQNIREAIQKISLIDSKYETIQNEILQLFFTQEKYSVPTSIQEQNYKIELIQGQLSEDQSKMQQKQNEFQNITGDIFTNDQESEKLIQSIQQEENDDQQKPSYSQIDYSSNENQNNQQENVCFRNDKLLKQENSPKNSKETIPSQIMAEIILKDFDNDEIIANQEIQQNNIKKQNNIMNQYNIQKQNNIKKQYEIVEQNRIEFQSFYYFLQQQQLLVFNQEQEFYQEIDFSKLNTIRSTNTKTEQGLQRQFLINSNNGTIEIGAFYNDNREFFGEIILSLDDLVVHYQNVFKKYDEISSNEEGQKSVYKGGKNKKFLKISSYKGEIKKGKEHGIGKLIQLNKNPILIYIGAFIEGKKQGFGNLEVTENFLKPGDFWKYEGQFEKNQFSGKGTIFYYDFKGVIQSTGYFKQGKQTGRHDLIFKDCDGVVLEKRVKYFFHICNMIFRIQYRLYV